MIKKLMTLILVSMLTIGFVAQMSSAIETETRSYVKAFYPDKKAAYSGEESPAYTRFATSEGFTLVPSITYDNEAEDMYLISTANGNSGGNGYIKKL